MNSRNRPAEDYLEPKDISYHQTKLVEADFIIKFNLEAIGILNAEMITYLDHVKELKGERHTDTVATENRRQARLCITKITKQSSTATESSAIRTKAKEGARKVIE